MTRRFDAVVIKSRSTDPREIDRLACKVLQKRNHTTKFLKVKRHIPLNNLETCVIVKLPVNPKRVVWEPKRP